MSDVMFECDLGEVSYPIYAGDIFSNIDEYVARVYKGNQVLIVIDEVVDQMYGEIIYPRLKERYRERICHHAEEYCKGVDET